MTVKPFTGFRCSDGRTFESRAEAEAWERAGRLAAQLKTSTADNESLRDWLFENWSTIKAGVTQTLEERNTEEK